MKDYKCEKCGEVLVTGEYLEDDLSKKGADFPDEYVLLKSHMYYCDSKEGRAYSKSVDDSAGHSEYCNCERCV